MDEVIEVNDRFYILATSSRMDEHVRVLKDGDTFALFDHFGDIQPIGLGEQGLYCEGTRFLSRLELRLGGERPLLLSSNVTEDNVLLAVDLTNPDLCVGDEVVVPRDSLHIARTKFLWQGTCYERLLIRNYERFPIEVSVSVQVGVDFVDIFEVRGMRRARRGQIIEPVIEEGRLVLGYTGLDGVKRRTTLAFSPALKVISPSELLFNTRLEPKQEATLFLSVSCEPSGTISQPLTYDDALVEASDSPRNRIVPACGVYTSNDLFNAWLDHSLADLKMMMTDTPMGSFPYAGVPWFATIFGRDGIITAMECLWVNPEIARGVLTYLAHSQATDVVPEWDAEPGKILHETRRGEMAALGEIPFGRYYGSADASALFVMLAAAYYERTGDRHLIQEIWPNIELALQWCDTYGDVDGDGFVEYVRHSPLGLVNQGWKDSRDSVFHADGALAEGPIALCEVQAYVYAAKRGAAELASLLGHKERAQKLLGEASALQERFEQAFWCDELSTYALALDGAKRPCQVRTSNAGHCLFTGIASEDHGRRTAETLFESHSFSGWGIRTLATTEARYNPMSYHNGSVWPHDNALIASGLARYGLGHLVSRVLSGLFDASMFLERHRLPELFCGFERRLGEGPTLYPIANSPQSWAAASVYSLLQSCLGLSIKSPQAQLVFSHPLLPEFLQEVHIKNLRVGEGSVDLSIHRRERDVSIDVTRREGSVDIVVMK